MHWRHIRNWRSVCLTGDFALLWHWQKSRTEEAIMHMCFEEAHANLLHTYRSDLNYNSCAFDPCNRFYIFKLFPGAKTF